MAINPQQPRFINSVHDLGAFGSNGKSVLEGYAGVVS
jgi:hypothetical protein